MAGPVVELNADCTDVRIDHLDNNTAAAGVDPAPAIYDETRNKIYFVYAEQHDPATSASVRNHGVYFREYDPVTETFATAVPIKTSTTASEGIDYPNFVRLADGRLIVVWRWTEVGGTKVETSESTDNGVTWSAVAGTTALMAEGRDCIGMSTDGTNVRIWTWAGGGDVVPPGPGKNMNTQTRTGVTTWSSETTVFDGGDADVYESFENGPSRRTCLQTSNTSAMICQQHVVGGGAPSSVKMECIYTTDGSSFTTVTIKDYGASSTQAGVLVGPRVWRGADGRVRCMWIEQTAGINKPIFAYSDDEGQTWTLVGTPDVDTSSTVEVGDWAFALDSASQLYYSRFYSTTFRVYRSGSDSATGWALVHSCNYVGDTRAAGERVEMFFAGPDYYHCFQTQDSPGPHLQLSFLSETLGPTGGGPAPTIQAFGGTDNNEYVRLDMADGKGWSVHHHAVSCWLDWDEGDFETGREINILLGGVPDVYPEIVDTEIAPVIYRIEVDEELSRRAYVEDTGGAVVVRNDPLRFKFVSKEYSMTGGGARDLHRAVQIRWIRNGDPSVMCQVYVDRVKLNHVIELYNTNGQSEERYFPLPADLNVGSTIQFVIEDDTEWPFVLEMIEVKYIPKGWRGRPRTIPDENYYA